MGEQTASYRVRLARPDEVPRLRAIEDAAGTLFSGLGLIDEALDVSFPLDDLARLVGIGQVWAGCLEDGLPVGMVIASVREETVYVEEMDVLPEHGRRGLRARLLACSPVSAHGHKSRVIRRSPCRPSATCHGMDRSTEGTASGTWSPRNGRRACGRSASRKRGTASVSRHGS